VIALQLRPRRCNLLPDTGHPLDLSLGPCAKMSCFCAFLLFPFGRERGSFRKVVDLSPAPRMMKIQTSSRSYPKISNAFRRGLWDYSKLSHCQETMKKTNFIAVSAAQAASTRIRSSVLFGICLFLISLSNTWSAVPRDYQNITSGTQDWFNTTPARWNQNAPWDGTPNNPSLLSTDNLDNAPSSGVSAIQLPAVANSTVNVAINNLSASSLPDTFTIRPSSAANSTVVLTVGADLTLGANNATLSIRDFDSAANQLLQVSVLGDVEVGANSTLILGRINQTHGIHQFTVVGTTEVSGTFLNHRESLSTDLGDLDIKAGGSVVAITSSNASGNVNSTVTLTARSLSGSGSFYGTSMLGTNTRNATLALNTIASTDADFEGELHDITGVGVGTNTLAVTVSGSGAQTFSGNNTYTGNTTVINGMLIGDHNSAFGAGTVLANGGVTRIASTRTIGNAITINGGELNVRGTASGAVTFGASGGRISGNGTVSQAVAFNNVNQVIAPGNSPGIISYGTSQNWSSFTYEWELNSWDPTAVAGTNFDQISITGSLDFGTASANSIHLRLFSLLGDDTPGNIPGFAEQDRQWIILTTTDGIDDFDAIHWNIITTNFTSSPGWSGTWSVTADTNQVFLNYTAFVIPEPGTGMLILLGTALLVALRRRVTARRVQL